MGQMGRIGQPTPEQRTVEARAPSSAVSRDALARAIVLASDSPLLWEPLLGRPLLAWAAAAFERSTPIGDIALVVAPERMAEAESLAAREGWRRTRVIGRLGGPGEMLRAGCDTLAALASADADDGLIVVHEGARPLVTPELIAQCVAAAARTGAVICAEPAVETIKRVRGEWIVATLPRERLVRERLVRVQTPAAFTRALLRSLLGTIPAEADFDGDLGGDLAGTLATLALAAGMRLATLAGSAENRRVSAPDDLAVAEALLRRRAAAGALAPPRES